MKPILLIFSLAIIACLKTKKDSNIPLQIEDIIQSDSLVQVSFDLDEHLLNYEKLKKNILIEKDSLDLNKESRMRFYRLLKDSIFPYWEGTSWDFNGISEKPRSGSIACGYFVSTTLRDMGLKINRYKIAQMASSEIVKSFTDSKHIKTFRKSESALAHMQTLNEGEICIVGLSYHVGFLSKIDSTIHFSHSTFVGPSCVVDEVADSSSVFENSDIFVIGRLNASDHFMKKWLD